MTAPDTQLEVYADLEALSLAAAAIFATTARQAITRRGRFLTALSGGRTPEGLFAALAKEPYASLTPWSKCHFFWGDERLVPPDEPGSSYRQARTLLLDKVDVPAANIHRARGELPRDEAVADYKQQLAQFGQRQRPWPRFDLVLLGLGRDGHTASLFPGRLAAAALSEPVLGVTAVYEDRPAARLTLTPPVFNDARLILILVAGAGKAEALAAVRHGPFAPETWPAQHIQPQKGRLIWLVDEAAHGP